MIGVGRRGCPALLLVAVDDAAAVEVVWRDLDADLVAGKHADAEPAHLAGEKREQLVIVLELDAEQQVRQGLGDLAVDFELLLYCHRHTSFGKNSAGTRTGTSARDPFILDPVDALDAFRLVDLLGVAAGAAGGALAARRQDSFDLVGVLGLAFAGGLGGGLLRDLLLNTNTPVALTDALYLPTVITAAIVVSVIAGEPGPKILRSVRILDALAVGFFAVASALRAREAGVTVPAQLLIGVIGGSGGALLRDVL